MRKMDILLLLRSRICWLSTFGWILLCLNFFGTSSAAKEWRGIVPLKSTKADVLRLLGTPKSENPDFSSYIFKDVSVTIYYNMSVCSNLTDCGCVASKDAVTNINVTLNREVKFSQIREKGVRFVKKINPHFLGMVHYVSDEIGVAYVVNEDGLVSYINYYESARDCQDILNSRTGNSKNIKTKCLYRPTVNLFLLYSSKTCFTDQVFADAVYDNPAYSVKSAYLYPLNDPRFVKSARANPNDLSWSSYWGDVLKRFVGKTTYHAAHSSKINVSHHTSFS